VGRFVPPKKDGETTDPIRGVVEKRDTRRTLRKRIDIPEHLMGRVNSNNHITRTSSSSSHTNHHTFNNQTQTITNLNESLGERWRRTDKRVDSGKGMIEEDGSEIVRMLDEE